MKTKAKAPFAYCDVCPLSRSKCIPGRGSRNAPIVIVGESPGKVEFRKGQVFVGPSGILLQSVLNSNGSPEVWVTNCALCFTSSSSKKEHAVEYCRKRLTHEIKSIGPKKILALGNTAMNTLLPLGGGSMTSRRGHFEFSSEFNAHILSTFHPAAVLRNPRLFRDFISDVEKILIKEPRGELTGRAQVQILHTAQQVTYQLYKARKGLAVLDLETSGFSCFDDYILCAVITTRNHCDGDKLQTSILPKELVYDPSMKSVFEHSGVKWIGHGSKFDRLFLLAQGVANTHFTHDTMLAHYVLDERRGTHNLKGLCSYIFDVPDWERDIKQYLKKPKTDSYAQLPKDVLYRYASYDGLYTYMLHEHFEKILMREEHEHERWVYENLLIPGADALANVELAGVKVDEEMMDRLSTDYESQMTQLEDEMQEITGDPDFNPRSPKQISHFLFDVYGLDSGMGRTTNYHALRKLAEQHPLAEKMLDYRHLHKRRQTYIEGWRKQISRHDERIHAYFGLHATVSGRLSCSRPNLQNLPYDMENMIISESDKVLVQADYSQVELRMLAIQSEDPWLLGVYRRDGDLHTERALQLFGPDYTKEQRVFAKRIHFGLAYGRSAKSLAEDSNLPGFTMEKALAVVEEYFTRMPKVTEWIAVIQQHAKKHGYVRSLTGRKRRFPLITWANQAEVNRQAINFMCQSPASDAMLASLIRVQEYFRNDPEFKLIHSIHDSLIAEVPPHRAEDVGQTMKSIMEETATKLFGDLIPYTVDIGIGTRKGDL